MAEWADAFRDQADIHCQAIDALAAVEHHIDRLRDMGPCPLNGYNALSNIKQRLRDLVARIPDCRE